MFSSAKSKFESYLNTSNVNMDERIAERVTAEVATEAGTSPTKLASNEMVAEGGGHTGVHFTTKRFRKRKVIRKPSHLTMRRFSLGMSVMTAKPINTNPVKINPLTMPSDSQPSNEEPSTTPNEKKA